MAATASHCCHCFVWDWVYILSFYSYSKTGQNLRLNKGSVECFVYKWRCYGIIDLWICYIFHTPSNISFSFILWPQPSKQTDVCFRRHKTVLGIKTVKLDCHCQATPPTYTDTFFMNFKLPNFPQGATYVLGKEMFWLSYSSN